MIRVVVCTVKSVCCISSLLVAILKNIFIYIVDEGRKINLFIYPCVVQQGGFFHPEIESNTRIE